MQKTLSPTRHSKIAVLSLIVGGLLLAGCQAKPTTQTDNYAQSTGTTATSTTTSAPVTNTSMQTAPAKTGDTIATIETDKGTIKFKIFTDQVPEIAKNFIELAKAGKFDNVPFHRVIEGFMIQTGDFNNQNGTGGYSYKGPGTKLDDEIDPDLSHIKGAVSMANAGPNTNGSQFFIVTGDQGATFLDGKYSLFGQVIEGQDVADAISKVPTGPMDKPVTPLMMKKVIISTF